MNALRSITLILLGLTLAGPATAQSYRRDVASDGGYDYARVIRVDPIIESGRYGDRTDTSQRCYYRDADDDYGYDDRYPDGGYGNGNGGYREDRYPEGDYGQARGSETGRSVATMIGGIAGAVLGSKMGDGSGRYVGSAVGSMVGGMAGRSIYDSAQRERSRQRGTVRVCDPVPAAQGGYGGYGDGRVAGYDVTYEYAGRTYHARTGHHPGDRIRVRVDVRPE